MKILMIKLGALGDVLRTTPVLTGLKKKYGNIHVTWIVEARHEDILRGNPLIGRLLSYSQTTLETLKKESFDLAINLDKEEEALEAMSSASAHLKMGFARDAKGRLSPVNRLSDYSYRLGIDDELKFRKNKKTYQQISFEQVDLEFRGEEYLFSLDEASRAFSAKHLKSLGVDTGSHARPIVGLNTGSGARFAGKKLPLETQVRLARFFQQRLNATVLLLGGEDETARNAEIARQVGGVVNTGSHPIRRFAGIVSACDVIVSGDTTAMHIAIAVKVPVVAYFASTCSAEIELYGRGRKIVSDISCAPCYKKICPIDEQCMKDMDAESVYRAVADCLSEAGFRGTGPSR